MPTPDPSTHRSKQRQRGTNWDSLLASLAILFLALAYVQARNRGWIADGQSEAAKRGIGFCIGLIMAFLGNSLPKRLPPLEDEVNALPCSAQSSRRALGWLFFLAGTLTAAGWLLLPFEAAQALAVALPLVALLAGSAFHLVHKQRLDSPGRRTR